MLTAATQVTLIPERRQIESEFYVSLYRYLVILLLAGCATTAGDVMLKGQRTDYTSSKAPRDVARCLDRNALDIRWGLYKVVYPARIRAGETADSLEVIYSGMNMDTIAIAVVRPAGTGSQFSIWRNVNYIKTPRGDGTVEQQMTRGCGVIAVAMEKLKPVGSS